jgi:hypothetical protein
VGSKAPYLGKGKAHLRPWKRGGRLRTALAMGPAYAHRDTGRAMSEENVQIVRRVFDALESPDAAVRALWHPDVEFDVSRDIWGPSWEVADTAAWRASGVGCWTCTPVGRRWTSAAWS